MPEGENKRLNGIHYLDINFLSESPVGALWKKDETRPWKKDETMHIDLAGAWTVYQLHRRST